MKRLDVYISEKYGLSRSYVKKILGEGQITYPNKKLKPGTDVDELEIDKLAVVIPKPVELTAVPEDIAVEIVYEDEDLAVVNKPKGMVVHPSAGHTSETLVNALLFQLKSLSGIGGVLRPGIVHRLDKDTQGLLIVAKNDEAHQKLTAMLKARQIEKRYRALLQGEMSVDGDIIENYLGRASNDRKKMAVVPESKGKLAITEFTKLKVINNKTLVDICLHTGRTHQVRVHFAHLGFPLVGDPLYGPVKKRGNGQYLIAYYLKFKHPRNDKELVFELNLPAWAKL